MGISVTVQQPGLLTTIQDQGRDDYLAAALSRGGAQDGGALAIANRLVGNAPSAAGLEITGMGPTLTFDKQLCVACFGAPIKAVITTASQQRCDLPLARPVIIPAGATIRFSSFIRGFRTWMAFAGGIDAPVVLGSRSSHIAADIGPPRLAAKSTLRLGAGASPQTARMIEAIAAHRAPGVKKQTPSLTPTPAECLSPRWSVANHLLTHWPVLEIPVMAGRHFDALPSSEQAALLAQQWRVDARGNRQGLALDGNALATAGLPHIMSEPVRFGTVQLPPSGKPFVLMAEHQTTGGYPRVLEVISAARPLLAQASPGSSLQFVMVDGQRARKEAARQSLDHARICHSIDEWIKPTRG